MRTKTIVKIIANLVVALMLGIYVSRLGTCRKPLVASTQKIMTPLGDVIEIPIDEFQKRFLTPRKKDFQDYRYNKGIFKKGYMKN